METDPLLLVTGELVMLLLLLLSTLLLELAESPPRLSFLTELLRRSLVSGVALTLLTGLLTRGTKVSGILRARKGYCENQEYVVSEVTEIFSRVYID